MSLTGEIRQLKYGIMPYPSPSFVVIAGQMVGGKENPMQVVQIIKEHVLNGKCEYHIQCVKKDEKGFAGNPFIWKTYYREPDEIQYFSPDEIHNFLVI